MADLLKLKLKANKTMIIVTIDRIKQKSFRSIEIVTVKVINQPIGGNVSSPI